MSTEAVSNLHMLGQVVSRILKPNHSPIKTKTTCSITSQSPSQIVKKLVFGNLNSVSPEILPADEM